MQQQLQTAVQQQQHFKFQETWQNDRAINAKHATIVLLSATIAHYM